METSIFNKNNILIEWEIIHMVPLSKWIKNIFKNYRIWIKFSKADVHLLYMSLVKKKYVESYCVTKLSSEFKHAVIQEVIMDWLSKSPSLKNVYSIFGCFLLFVWFQSHKTKNIKSWGMLSGTWTRKIDARVFFDLLQLEMKWIVLYFFFFFN